MQWDFGQLKFHLVHKLYKKVEKLISKVGKLSLLAFSLLHSQSVLRPLEVDSRKQKVISSSPPPSALPWATSTHSNSCFGAPESLRKAIQPHPPAPGGSYRPHLPAPFTPTCCDIRAVSPSTETPQIERPHRSKPPPNPPLCLAHQRLQPSPPAVIVFVVQGWNLIRQFCCQIPL